MAPLRLLLAVPLAMSALRHSSDSHSGEAVKIFDLVIIVLLTIGAGLMSGLTLGLMSMDHVDLEVLKRSGTEIEKKHAERLTPVLARPHLLLVTLLLFNAAAMEALPLFIDKLTNPATAVILSVTVVLLFGEIIPQAVCKTHGLAIGSYSTWLVRFLILLGLPISWPIAKLLDYLLGEHHSALFRRGQLKALVDVHGAQSGMGGFLTKDEISVIRGALDLTNKLARVAMTSLDQAFMLSSDAVLDGETLARILRMGHSRVPVHVAGDRSQLLGVVLVKELVLLDPDDNVRVDSMRIRQVPFLPASIPMYDLLRLFQTGRSHMVFLRKPPPDEEEESTVVRDVTVYGQDGQPPAPEGHMAVTIQHADPEDEEEEDEEQISDFEQNARPGDVVGIITIEDVIEELIGEEIVDETDTHVDNERKQKVNASQQARRLPESLRSVLKMDRAQSVRTRAGVAARRQPSSKPPMDVLLSRGNSELALPPGTHADALNSSQLRRASTSRPPSISTTASPRPLQAELRRSFTDDFKDVHKPLLSNGGGSDVDDGSEADSSAPNGAPHSNLDS